VNAKNPALIIENKSGALANGITWELVMFRTTDQAFMSYATQSIGYLKANTISPGYVLSLNTIGRAPQTPPVENGASYIGAIGIDCPTCKGVTLIVSFVWGESGWFYDAPGVSFMMPLE
jgi:hypothetical protein